MTALQRNTKAVCMAASLVVLAFPPFVEIDGLDTGHTRFHFLPYIFKVEWRTFIYPITAMYVLFELAAIWACAGLAYAFIKWVGHRKSSDQDGESNVYSTV